MRRVYYMTNGRKVYFMTGGQLEMTEKRARALVKRQAARGKACFIENPNV